MAHTVNTKQRVGAFAISLLLCCSLALSLSPALAGAKNKEAQVAKMQVLISGEKTQPSTVEIYALTNATEFPAVVDIMLPSDAKDITVEEFGNDSSKAETVDIRLAPSEIDTKTDVRYQVKLTKGANFKVTLKISYSAFEGANMGDTPVASFGLVAPADLEEVLYGFVALHGTMGIGKEIERLADSKKGAVYGVRHENVKRGMMSTASVAFVESQKAQAEIAKVKEESELDKAKASIFRFNAVVYGLVGLLIVVIAVVLVLILRDRNKAVVANEETDE